MLEIKCDRKKFYIHGGKIEENEVVAKTSKSNSSS